MGDAMFRLALAWTTFAVMVGASPAWAQRPSASGSPPAFQPDFVRPKPATFAAGLDLPLAPDDQIIANCAEVYTNELPVMTTDEQREFNKNTICVLPSEDSFDKSFVHYSRVLKDRGFKDESGTYVQSGVRISCNRTHSVVMSVMGQFTPPFVLDPRTGETKDVPNGGTMMNMALMFNVVERPCERYRQAAAYFEPAPPENYRDMPTPLFLDLQPQVKFGDYQIPLRTTDRLVSHCGQYYREEIGENIPSDATPEEFARHNQLLHCIYVPPGTYAEAAAYYIAKIEADGFTRTPSRDEPNPSADQRFPMFREGTRAWYGRVVRCNGTIAIDIGALARHGPTVLMDAGTGEFFKKRDKTGGRAAKLDGASFPNQILTIRFLSAGCM